MIKVYVIDFQFEINRNLGKNVVEYRYRCPLQYTIYVKVTNVTVICMTNLVVIIETQ